MIDVRSHPLLSPQPLALTPADCVADAIAAFDQQPGQQHLLILRPAAEKGSPPHFSGWLSPLDLLRSLHAGDIDSQTRLETLAVAPPVTLRASDLDNLSSILTQLSRYHLSELPVLDADNRFLGLLCQPQLYQTLANIATLNAFEPSIAVTTNDTESSEGDRPILHETVPDSLLQQKLYSSYAQTCALLGAMYDLILVIDVQGEDLKLSIPSTNIAHQTQAEIVEATIAEFFGGAQQALFEHKVRQTGQTQQVAQFEYCIAWDRNQSWFLATLSPLGEDSILWVARDITRRKQAEATVAQLTLELEQRIVLRTADLERSNTALQQEIQERTAVETTLRRERNFINAILNDAGMPIAIFDRAGRIVRFNRACEDLTGYTFAEVAGKPFWQVFLVNDAVEAAQAQFNKLLNQHQLSRAIVSWRNKSGHLKRLKWCYTLLTDAEGQVTHVIGMGMDCGILLED
jgi:PAS domain S-box-containing protein